MSKLSLGILTANVAAYFVESKETDTNAELERKLDEVLRRLESIEAAQSGGPKPHAGEPEQL